MGAIIGPHIINGTSPHRDQLLRWKPNLITLLDGRHKDGAWIERNLPSTTVVNRIYVEDSDVNRRIAIDPEQAAQWAHNLVMENFTPTFDYWQIANEVHQNYAGISLLNRFELARMKLADAAGAKAYKCGIFAFSVGNPDMPENDRMALWRKCYPAIEYAAKHGHVIVAHQYGQPTLWGPGDESWFISRIEKQVLPRLPFRGVKFAITEYGIDGLIWTTDGKAKGWLGYTDAAGYARQLIDKGIENEEWADSILGYSVFTLGHNPPWQTYDIAGRVTGILSNYYRDEKNVAADDDEQGDVYLPGVPLDDGLDAPEYIPRISIGANKMGLSHSIAKGGLWRLKILFTTKDGSWETSDDPYSVPQWARDKYLSHSFDDAGGDHHLFVRFEDKNGKPLPEIALFRTPYAKETALRDTNNKGSLWQNIPIYGGSNFAPDRGEIGPWTWGPAGEKETYVRGGGLPFNRHVSTFAVFERYDEVLPEPVPAPVPAPVPEPAPQPTPQPTRPSLRVRAPLVEPMLITQQWGDNPEKYARFGMPYHNGTDFAGRFGDPVFTVEDGIVAWESVDSDYGNYIRVWHPDLLMHSFYAHLSESLVKAGDIVKAGQTIGKVGSTGNSTGPHLHFEIRLAQSSGAYAESPYADILRGRINPMTLFEVQKRLQGNAPSGA